LFLHRKRNEVIKHDCTQTALAHDWRNQSSWNKYKHAAKVIAYALVCLNKVLHFKFVHRKISTLTWQTDRVSVIGKVRTEYEFHISKDAEVNIKHQSKHNFTLLISENNYSTSIAQNSIHF
jgi:hypothetical protein